MAGEEVGAEQVGDLAGLARTAAPPKAEQRVLGAGDLAHDELGDRGQLLDDLELVGVPARRTFR